MKWQMKSFRRMIPIFFLLLILVPFVIDHSSNMMISLGNGVESTKNLQSSSMDSVYCVVTAQNVCLACDLEGIKFLREPPNMNYTEGSTGNYLWWTINYFTNYTVSFDGEIIAQGGRTYTQDFLPAERVYITKERRYYNMTINVDGLDLGSHNIVLFVQADLRYACPMDCCICGSFGPTNRYDKVVVIVEPKAAFIISGFGPMEGGLAIACLVMVAYKQRQRR